MLIRSRAIGEQSDQMGFYKYCQNNTGGSFDIDESVSINVWIQADSPIRANAIAVNEASIYFDGVARAIDCACCGDRWHELYETDMPDFKTLEQVLDYYEQDSILSYTKEVTKTNLEQLSAWVNSENDPVVIIYLLDGTKHILRSK